MISMLRHAEAYYDRSERISIWLIKLYSKLGMMSLVHRYQQNFMFKARRDDLNYQRLGAAKLSTYSDFGMNGYLEELLFEYKDFYRDKVNSNKNKIVTAFLQKDFEIIWPKMKENETISRLGFQHTIALAQTVIRCGKFVVQPQLIHQIFNKQFDHV